MDSDFSRLLGLHHVASAHGGGLKPELLEMLERMHPAAQGNVVPLGTRLASAGPAEQPADDAALAQSGIARIGAAAPAPAATKRG
ncbi:MAG: hypothetical protein AAGF60_13520 [Pseudomonadota bacterium]